MLCGVDGKKNNEQTYKSKHEAKQKGRGGIPGPVQRWIFMPMCLTKRNGKRRRSWGVIGL